MSEEVKNSADQNSPAKKNEVKIVRTMENASGEVTHMDGQTINVIYKRTESAEYELSLPIDEKVELSGYRKATEIQAGDQVELAFERMVTAPGEPEERTERVVKKIRFVKRPEQDKSLHSNGEGQ